MSDVVIPFDREHDAFPDRDDLREPVELVRVAIDLVRLVEHPAAQSTPITPRAGGSRLPAGESDGDVLHHCEIWIALAGPQWPLARRAPHASSHVVDLGSDGIVTRRAIPTDEAERGRLR